ncbi:LPXTG cell wall anchor domain-containing protein [Agromyces seonyuensis]|uniref:LPXTG cell wall anchor domain-containing protein n=1 Tax=Agromyces seonyuensis TaxID=2662446 RepID=A0A6I4P4Z0_9MICO|nr:LPXTG cell wall anchor domain-containing protein [Agromyces seonyuensis]MWC00036.1 LPXTG cell wall anchor domain-containing protein [Agromyces seonyuensis]
MQTALLADTGANVMPWLIAAGVLVILGLVAVLVVNARRASNGPPKPDATASTDAAPGAFAGGAVVGGAVPGAGGEQPPATDFPTPNDGPSGGGWDGGGSFGGGDGGGASGGDGGL